MHYSNVPFQYHEPPIPPPQQRALGDAAPDTTQVVLWIGAIALTGALMGAGAATAAAYLFGAASKGTWALVGAGVGAVGISAITYSH